MIAKLSVLQYTCTYMYTLFHICTECAYDEHVHCTSTLYIIYMYTYKCLPWICPSPSSVCWPPSSGWLCTGCSNSLPTSGLCSRSQPGTWSVYTNTYTVAVTYWQWAIHNNMMIIVVGILNNGICIFCTLTYNN